MISPGDLELFRDLTARARRVVITTHIHPDGDAVGSQVGLVRYLSTLGKETRIVNVDPTPEILRFIEDPEHPVETWESRRHAALLGQVDLVILVDNSVPDRLGPMERPMLELSERVLCIDHHPARGTPWGHTILVDRACATAVLIYELIHASGWTPDLSAATALYAGIATDSGFFRFNSTNADAHRVAADLIELGVSPAVVYRAIHERNSEAFTRLLGHALVDMRVHAEGRVAVVTLTQELVRSLDAEGVDPSEITSTLLALDGVQVAALFRELPDGRVKVSLRSKGSVDVHRLASEFGGGGHRNASGIVIEGALQQATETVVARAAAVVA